MDFKIVRKALSTFVLLGLGLAASAHADNTTPRQFGVYLGAGCDGTKRLPAYATWVGRSPVRALDFFDNSSWDNMIAAAKWSSGCWAKTGLSMTYSVPMLVGTTTTLAQGAAGAYDAYFKKLAEALVAAGQGSSIIRIGWEFNGNWYTWAASKDPTSWVAYWRRIVTAMRSASGAQFKFDWCPALGTVAIAPEKVYPGDDVVDIIGMDVYNQSWIVNWTDPAARWKQYQDGPNGLTWHRNFALSHGKPISYPEWGTGTRADGHGGGDDPLFVDGMNQFIAQSGVLYHNYWEFTAPDYDAKLSTGKFPNAATTFLNAYKPATVSSTTSSATVTSTTSTATAAATTTANATATKTLAAPTTTTGTTAAKAAATAATVATTAKTTTAATTPATKAATPTTVAAAVKVLTAATPATTVKK